MFFEVLSPIYHSPITIESVTCRVLLGTRVYSASVPALVTKKSNRCRPHFCTVLESAEPSKTWVSAYSAVSTSQPAERLQWLARVPVIPTTACAAVS
jgi:hypothetical protein